MRANMNFKKLKYSNVYVKYEKYLSGADWVKREWGAVI